MPELTNRRQELFCRFLAEGNTTQATAYELAGYTPSTSNASVLANKPDIKARVAELRQEFERKEQEFQIALKKANLDPDDPEGKRRIVIEWTTNEVRNMLAENARLAQIAGQFQAAKESIKLIGDSMGMFEKGGGSNTPALGSDKPSPVSLTFINQTLESAGEPDLPSDNPLAPRPSRAGKTTE